MAEEVARPARSRWTRRRIAVTAVLAVVLVAVVGFAVAYSNLQSQVTSVDIDDLVAPPPTTAAAPTTEDDGDAAAASEPTSATPSAEAAAEGAMDILVIGSDSRADGAVDDGVTSVLADTHIVVHISADRSRVELISIPRDAMVQIPACPTTSGKTVAARFGQYNSAYARAYTAGGDTTSAIACDVTLVQSVTGLRMDGFVLVEMGGFVKMVDALGGVEIDIPEAINLPSRGLVLAAGPQRLDGTQALAYVRARIGVGDGSDISRIGRQQQFMQAMVDEALSRNLLTDAGALYGFASATLSSLTVSENFSSITDLASLGLDLRGIDSSDVTFATAPFEAYPSNPNRVQLAPEAEDLWAALRQDQPISVDGG